MKKQLTFKLLGVLLSFIALGLAGYAFWFLGSKLNMVFGSNEDIQPAVVQFDLDKVSELK